MSQAVHAYVIGPAADIPISERFYILLPQDARILGVTTLDGAPTLLVLGDHDAKAGPSRSYRFYRTEEPVPEEAAYVGTITFEGAVLHLFQVWYSMEAAPVGTALIPSTIEARP